MDLTPSGVLTHFTHITPYALPAPPTVMTKSVALMVRVLIMTPWVRATWERNFGAHALG